MCCVFQCVACCLVAAACAAPQTGGQPEVRVVSETFDNDDAGNYEFSYELDNGQRVRAESSALVS